MRMADTQNPKKLSYSQQLLAEYAQLIDKRKKAYQASFIMKLVVALRVFIPIGTGIGAAMGAFVFPLLGPIAGSMLGGAVASIFGVVVPVTSTLLQKVYRSFKRDKLLSSKKSQIDRLNQAREQHALDHNILLKNLDNGTRTGDSLFSLGGRVTGQVYSHSNTPSAIIGQSIGSASGALIGLAPEIYELMQYKRAKAKGIAYDYERYHQRHKKISIFASRFRFAGLILMPIGLALGAVLGTFLFTGLGAAAVGFIFSAGFATIGGLIYSTIFLKKNTSTLSSHTSNNSKSLQEKKMQQEYYKRYARVGITLSLPSCSAIGAIIGTFVFPGLGTITGAAIGSVVGALLGSVAGYFYSRHETHQSVKTNSFANKSEVLPAPALTKRTYGSLIKTGARMGSMIGAAVGGIVGSVIPVVGTIAGTFIGAGMGSLVGVITAYGASYFVQHNYKNHAIENVQQVKNGEYDQLIKKRLGHFGMGTWFGATLGAGIGAIIGTFVFPGLGTMVGAAIGSALGGVTSGVIGVIISKMVGHHHKGVMGELKSNETTSFMKANYRDHLVDDTVALSPPGGKKTLAQVQALRTNDGAEYKSLSNSYANILTATEKVQKEAEVEFIGTASAQQKTIKVINEQNDKDLHSAESHQFWKKENASTIKQEKSYFDLPKQRSKVIQAPQGKLIAQIERSMSKAGL